MGMCRPARVLTKNKKKSHVKSYGDYRPNGLVFHQNSLDMGPILVKKSLEQGPISQKVQNM